jgi:hypothetical protein
MGFASAMPSMPSPPPPFAGTQNLPKAMQAAMLPLEEITSFASAGGKQQAAATAANPATSQMAAAGKRGTSRYGSNPLAVGEPIGAAAAAGTKQLTGQ